MTINPTTPALKNVRTSLVNLYREGHPVPAALYRYTEQLFNKPAYAKRFTKERVLAHKIDQDLKKYTELHNKPKKKLVATPNYFLLHKKKFSLEDVATFYHSLDKLLVGKNANVVYELTPEQFAAIMPTLDIYVSNANDQLMIYLHGNQLITGAPLIIGGYPHLNYFQWGNLYGVVKYEEQEGEEVHEANLMIYFEDRHERKLEECMQDLLHRLQHQAEPPIPESTPEPVEVKSTAPRPEFGFRPPNSNDEEEK